MSFKWLRGIDKEKAKYFTIWLLWDFSGLRKIASMIWSPLAEGERRPVTFFLWLIGIYVALFGVASQRYENRVDSIENRANAIFMQLTTLSDNAFSRIVRVQALECPVKPNLTNPISVFKSLLFQGRSNEIVNQMKGIIEDRKHDLSSKHLSKAQLQGARLMKANLKNSHLVEANLHRALLSKANMQGAFLQGANLKEANLKDADLNKADLRNADLRNVTNLTLKQLSHVKTLYKARLDSELMKQVKEKYPHLLEKPLVAPSESKSQKR